MNWDSCLDLSPQNFGDGDDDFPSRSVGTYVLGRMHTANNICAAKSLAGRNVPCFFGSPQDTQAARAVEAGEG
jgi:hypothetical protein